MFGLSAEADPRAALAARRGIDVRIVGSGRGAVSSRCRVQLQVARLFTVRASACFVTGAARGSPEGTHGGRRPPAPIGWGSLTGRANLWRPLSHDGPEHAASFAAPRRPPQSLRHAGGLRRARPIGDRRRVRTTDPDEPGRLPSDRPGPCGPGGQDAFVVHVRGLARHPVACREPRPASSKADWSLQAIPVPARPASKRVSASRHAERARRKMLLSDFCNRLTTTCTQHGPSDSRAHLLPSPEPLRALARGIPCGTPQGSLAGPPSGAFAPSGHALGSFRSFGRPRRPAPVRLRSLDLQRTRPGWSVA
jgi:hypothetical protein